MKKSFKNFIVFALILNMLVGSMTGYQLRVMGATVNSLIFPYNAIISQNEIDVLSWTELYDYYGMAKITNTSTEGLLGVKFENFETDGSWGIQDGVWQGQACVYDISIKAGQKYKVVFNVECTPAKQILLRTYTNGYDENENIYEENIYNSLLGHIEQVFIAEGDVVDICIAFGAISEAEVGTYNISISEFRIEEIDTVQEDTTTKELLSDEEPSTDEPKEPIAPEGYTMLPADWSTYGDWSLYAGNWSDTHVAHIAYKYAEETPEQIALNFVDTTADDEWLVQAKYTFTDLQEGTKYKYSITNGEEVLASGVFKAEADTKDSDTIGLGNRQTGTEMNLKATCEEYVAPPTQDIGTADYGYQWSVENIALEIAPQYFMAMYGKYQGNKLYNELNCNPNEKKYGLNGLCYGFALSSAVLDSGDIKVNELFYEDCLFDIKNLYEIARSNYIIHQPIDLIIFSHLYQLSYDASSQAKRNHSIKNLIKALSKGEKNILVYVENMGHAVIARDIRQISETQWIVDVYDSNLPGDLNQIYIVNRNGEYGYSFTLKNHTIVGNTFFGTSDLTYMHISDNYIKTLMSGKTIDKTNDVYQFLLTANKDIEDNCNRELYEVTGYTEGENKKTGNNVYWVSKTDEDIIVRDAQEISLTGIDSDYEVLLGDSSNVVFKTEEEEIKSMALENNTAVSIIAEREIDGKQVSFEISGKTGVNATITSQEKGIKISNFDDATMIEVSSDGNILGKQTVDTKNVEISVDGDSLEINKNEDMETTTIEEKTTTKREETSNDSTTISNADTIQQTVVVKTAEDKTTGKSSTITANKKSTKIKKIKSKKKSLKVIWKKIKGVKGYQIQYSTSSKFRKSKKIIIKKAKTTSRTIKKLKERKRYYVRIRTYIIVNGKKKYSNWSKKKSQKTK